MALQVGFAEADITPAIGTHKIGWLKLIVSTEVQDPLSARVAVFRTPRTQIAVVSLDTLFIAEPEVAAIRQQAAQRYSLPEQHIMVCATHNHAGPAVAQAGDVPKDQAYAELLVSRTVAALGQALASLEPAEFGFGWSFEWKVAHNRRVVMRNGTTRTHGAFSDPQALYLEGPIDPEIAVIAARSSSGRLLGAIVNFACHPTHHGGDTVISAGYPGVVAREMRSHAGEAGSGGGPVTLFLNGASGNTHTSDPATGTSTSQEEAGRLLAEDAQRVIRGMEFRDSVRLGAAWRTVELPYRRVTADEVSGRARGAQRFIDPAIYERTIPGLVRTIQERGSRQAEIQVLFIDSVAIVGVPGELFVQFGLQIKQEAHPAHALVATCTNGRVGYIPTREAFLRGGYETTFGPTSMLAPEAGDLIVQTAVDLIRADAARHD